MAGKEGATLNPGESFVDDDASKFESYGVRYGNSRTLEFEVEFCDFVRTQLQEINKKVDGLNTLVDRVPDAIKGKAVLTNAKSTLSRQWTAISKKWTSQNKNQQKYARVCANVSHTSTSASRKSNVVLPPKAKREKNKSSITRSSESLSERFGTRIESLEQLADFIMCHEMSHQNRNKWKTAIWDFLEDNLSSRAASIYSKLMSVFILVSVMVALVELVPSWHNANGPGIYFHPVFELIFAVELTLRFVSCPNRLYFLRSMFNIIDLLSLLPLIPRMVLIVQRLRYPDADVRIVEQILCTAPTLRLMKLLRRFDKFHLLISAFQAAANALPVLLFTSLLLTLIFSTIFYSVEDRLDIPNYPTAVWLTVITMSTVGYGDYVAQSIAGQCSTTALIVIGQLYLAIPIAIVGVAFTDVWRDRNRLLLMQRLRDSVTRAGFCAEDVLRMLQFVDDDGDGELTIENFCLWIDLVLTKIPDEWIREVFETFDIGETGTIEIKEFLQSLFPAQLYQGASSQSSLDFRGNADSIGLPFRESEQTDTGEDVPVLC